MDIDPYVFMMALDLISPKRETYNNDWNIKKLIEIESL